MLLQGLIQVKISLQSSLQGLCDMEKGYLI